jgi:hypothetical protein
VYLVLRKWQKSILLYIIPLLCFLGPLRIGVGFWILVPVLGSINEGFAAYLMRCSLCCFSMSVSVGYMLPSVSTASLEHVTVKIGSTVLNYYFFTPESRLLSTKEMNNEIRAFRQRSVSILLSCELWMWVFQIDSDSYFTL